MPNLLRYPLMAFALTITISSWAQQLLVPPYLQPGDASSFSREEKVLIWQTDSATATYKVEFGIGKTFTEIVKISTAKIGINKLNLKSKSTLLYRAELPKLQFDATYYYRVSINGIPFAESAFNTRTKKNKTRFVAFGDCGAGTSQQAEIAYRVYQQSPQFVLVTGDNVYVNGLENEYRRKFFPIYLASEATPEKGAPLMSSIPFYMLVGNHDIYGADLDKFPDGLAYFYYNDLPLNAPVVPSTVKVKGDPERVQSFLKNAGPRFPRMTHFSFDYGNVHIACLDANSYTNPLDPVMIEWLGNDIKNSKADWKMVAFHHPGFNSSQAHYDYQYMRLLSPTFEQLGIDLVLNGHVHNYQRSLPLKFDPKKNQDGTQYIISPEGRVDGTFTIDQEFNGTTNTKPKGIIYVVTGAGGAPLYDPALSGKPDLWKHDPQENWVPFTAKIVSNIHSFTLIETNEKKLTLKQIDAKGNVIDEITVTK